jgi:hydroxyacylglutathione hydrolase
MILRQLLHATPTVGVSYVLGCAGQRTGIVVDPMVAPEDYIRLADELGLEIKYVIDTHVHADHLSTGRVLADAVKAEYVLHESVDAEFQFRNVSDHEQLAAGNVQLEVLHLPGHTPEHIGLLVTDRSRAVDPWFVLSGHTLMVGDMGRTELASSAEQGARALFRSAARLRGLPDHVEVLPGAFAGSVCGRGLSGKVTSTIGFERRFNKTFAIDHEATFVDAMLQGIPPQPPNAAATRAANLGRPPAAV